MYLSKTRESIGGRVWVVIAHREITGWKAAAGGAGACEGAMEGAAS